MKEVSLKMDMVSAPLRYLLREEKHAPQMRPKKLFLGSDMENVPCL